MSARRGVILILGICILVLPSPSGVAGGQGGAGERITRYHSEVEVGRDGALTVTETIAVRAEGRQIRRGIYRDFPTRYRDRLGNRVTARFEVLEVRRNGRPEPWFTERRPNGVRVNTGDDDLLPVPGEHTYTIRYRTERQLGFFAEHDELYWNVTGTGWDFAIDRASAEVRLPEPVAAEDLRIDLYTGAQGTQGRDARAEVPAPGLVRVATTAPLGPREGLTIAVGFPKGIVREPTRADRLGWLLYDNRGLLIVLAGLVLVLLFYLWRWQRRGRDPRAGTVIPEYEPPAGHSPAGLRYLRRMRYDDRCFAADLVEMGVAGHLRIHREGSGAAERWRRGAPRGRDPRGCSREPAGAAPHAVREGSGAGDGERERQPGLRGAHRAPEGAEGHLPADVLRHQRGVRRRRDGGLGIHPRARARRGPG
jgi:hypothetical protein